MTPLLTILLPTHNRADTLEWALRSVETQSLEDFEVLICGDGCTDETASVASAWEKRDARFRWLDLPKSPGFGYANRNIALREARGEFIGYMQHDDLIFRDHFQQLTSMFTHPSVNLAACSALWVDEAGTIIPIVSNLETSTFMGRLFEMGVWLPSDSYMHRRKAFADVGYWNEELTGRGDLEFWRRIVRHYGESCVLYQRNPGVLHFRANWKTAEQSDPHQFPGWEALLTKSGAFPENLRTTFSNGELPQAQIGRQLLGPSGLTWAEEVRASALLAFDAYVCELEFLVLKFRHEALWRSENVARLKERLLKSQTKLNEQRERAEKWKSKCERLRQAGK